MGVEVRQALHDVEVGLKRIELARKALALAEEKLRIERSKARCYSPGKGTPHWAGEGVNRLPHVRGRTIIGGRHRSPSLPCSNYRTRSPGPPEIERHRGVPDFGKPQPLFRCGRSPPLRY